VQGSGIREQRTENRESGNLEQFPIQVAGSRIHQEYWIPAAELDEFNRHIAGLIEMVSEFRGKSTDPVE
jgi:hypothetical protein